MENPSSKEHKIYRNQTEYTDYVAIEEPLEITITQLSSKMAIRKKPVSITMRTPGSDYELALGFLFSEGIIKNITQIKQHRTEENKIDIVLKPESSLNLQKLDRHFYTTSSCGICGKSSIEALKTHVPDYPVYSLEAHAELLKQLPGKLRAQQATFNQTGGLHAAALFSTTGDFLIAFEDVGRHNAMDKLVGHYLKKLQLPLNKNILLLSGRTSFELVQKSVMAGVQIICAIGAPSSLAIQLAEEHKCTLIGFLSSDRFNIYTGAKRIVF